MGVEISSPPSLSSSSLSEFAKRWMLRRAFPPSLPATTSTNGGILVPKAMAEKRR